MNIEQAKSLKVGGDIVWPNESTEYFEKGVKYELLPVDDDAGAGCDFMVLDSHNDRDSKHELTIDWIMINFSLPLPSPMGTIRQRAHE